MSYLKPDNLEVIQNFLQDAGPRGQISPEDTSNFVAPITVGLAELLDDYTGGSWTKRFGATEGVLLDTEADFSDAALARLRELGSKYLLAVPVPAQVSVLTSKHTATPLGTEVIFKTPEQVREDLLNWGLHLNKEERYIPQLIIGDEVLNTAIPMPQVAGRLQPVRILGEVEGGEVEGRKLAQLRTFESILNRMVDVPKSDPTGRNRLSVYESIPKCPCRARLSSWRIRGLLRSKTKKGPKRRTFANNRRG